MVTVRSFLAIIAIKIFYVHQMDVHNVFLHGDLEEELESTQGIFMCQRKDVLDIIYETGLLGAKPADFPMEQHHKLGLANGRVLKDVKSYRRLIRRLIYLSVTRPDLGYFVHILSKFIQEPRIEHWEAVLRVASCPTIRRSLSGWFVMLGGSPIS
ncbi:hypothetical protein LIER_43943 [Lithospermum erythrorhizon]|uniref:Reverse transcriptase Ty1/copia-type domain-containing protein n=1 Tax=Lithospermum erythrorhizon TaxID=34254 RepID=A0AAV3REF0_LITER